MAIEGPLRELGIHDVFQLLDLSRKTGTLRVTSELRDNEGVVYFQNGRVIHANIRSNPHPLGAVLVRAGKISEADLERAAAMQSKQKGGKRIGELLVEIGALNARELERQVRQQIEAVVFELMSWREGTFRFEERDVADAPSEAAITITTESLLMEGARRIDEWSRIADKVPHLGMVPTLAAVEDDHPSLLDLLPNEWEVLTMIDGARDLRAIATMLGRSEFDIARIAYGLVSTGVVELKAPGRGAAGRAADPRPHLEQAAKALEAGRADDALSASMLAIAADPSNAEARLLHGRALMKVGRHTEALDELRRAQKADPLNARAHLLVGFAAAREGEFQEAIASFQQFLKLAPKAPEVEQVRTALESVGRLRSLIEAHVGG